MDLLGSMRVFVAVAEARGLAAAARALHLSPPVVTRAIAALEERLEVRLLNRTTRQVNLTEAGERYLADCKRIIADLHAADDRARNARLEPQGVLKVTAPVMFGRMHIAPLLHDFMERNPKVTVRAVFVDRIVNLVEEGIDVALRIDTLTDSSLTRSASGRCAGSWSHRRLTLRRTARRERPRRWKTIVPTAAAAHPGAFAVWPSQARSRACC